MQQRSEAPRSHILEAALKCFSRSGFEATGVAEICSEAGVSKGAFYHHFPSKQAVFMELLENWLGLLDQQLGAARLEAHDVPAGLLSMVATARPVFQDADHQLPMFLEFWTQSIRNPEIWATTVAPYRRYEAYFARLVQEGIEEGSFADVDPMLASRVLLALAMGVLLQGLMDPKGAAWGEEASRGFEIILKGLRR